MGYRQFISAMVSAAATRHWRGVSTGNNLYVMRSGLPDDISTCRVREIEGRPGAAPVALVGIN